MDVPGSSSCLATLQELVLLDEDPCHRSRCDQWASRVAFCASANVRMDLPKLARS